MSNGLVLAMMKHEQRASRQLLMGREAAKQDIGTTRIPQITKDVGVQLCSFGFGGGTAHMVLSSLAALISVKPLWTRPQMVLKMESCRNAAYITRINCVGLLSGPAPVLYSFGVCGTSSTVHLMRSAAWAPMNGKQLQCRKNLGHGNSVNILVPKQRGLFKVRGQVLFDDIVPGVVDTGIAAEAPRQLLLPLCPCKTKPSQVWNLFLI